MKSAYFIKVLKSAKFAFTSCLDKHLMPMITPLVSEQP